MGVAIAAALCMIVQDVVGTVMVQAEAANRGWLAGWCDTFGWFFAIQSTSISVAAINGHSFVDRMYVYVFVGGSNLIGTKLGQVTGQRLLARYPAPTPKDASRGALLAQVADLAGRVDQLEREKVPYAE